MYLKGEEEAFYSIILLGKLQAVNDQIQDISDRKRTRKWRLPWLSTTINYYQKAFGYRTTSPNLIVIIRVTKWTFQIRCYHRLPFLATKQAAIRPPDVAKSPIIFPAKHLNFGFDSPRMDALNNKFKAQ